MQLHTTFTLSPRRI